MTADPLSNYYYGYLRRHPYNGQGIGHSWIGAMSITSAIILLIPLLLKSLGHSYLAAHEY